MRILALSHPDVDFRDLIEYVYKYKPDLIVYVGLKENKLENVRYEEDPLLYVKRRVNSCIENGEVICSLRDGIAVPAPNPKEAERIVNMLVSLYNAVRQCSAGVLNSIKASAASKAIEKVVNCIEGSVGIEVSVQC